MQRFVIRRLIIMLPMLLGISLISFLIIKIAPGDPLMALAIAPGDDADLSLEARDHLRRQMGLDQPIHVQYYRWLRQVMGGNLGTSLISSRPVLPLILSRIPATLTLTGSAMILALCIALPIGIFSAMKQYSLFDYLATIYAFVGLSIPSFWLGLMLMLVFGVRLGWFPTGGRVSLEAGPGWPTLVSTVRHHVLPVCTLTAVSLAGWVRYQRASMLEVISSDYIRTARAKGLAERVVVFKHAWRNALIPIITFLGFSLTQLINGSYVIEMIFSWPGMGRLGVQAIFSRDYPIIMGVTMLSAVLLLIGNLLADIAYAVVDPRIRYD